jgi:hypothetical protein
MSERIEGGLSLRDLCPPLPPCRQTVREPCRPHALPTHELRARRWNARSARRALDESAASEISVPAFARSHGVSFRTFWWREWPSRSRSSESPTFIPGAISRGPTVTVRMPRWIVVEAGDTAARPVGWLAEGDLWNRTSGAQVRMLHSTLECRLRKGDHFLPRSGPSSLLRRNRSHCWVLFLFPAN